MRERDIEHLLLTGRMPPRREEVSMPTRDELQTNAAIREMARQMGRIAQALERLVEIGQADRLIELARLSEQQTEGDDA